MTRGIPLHQVIGNAILVVYVVTLTLLGLTWWAIKHTWRTRHQRRPRS